MSSARCGVCEEARRDAYIARLELARLQARTTSLPTNGDAEAASEEDSPRWLDPSSPSERAEEGALDAALADAMALQRRADQYHAAFLSVQADNKGEGFVWFVMRLNTARVQRGGTVQSSGSRSIRSERTNRGAWRRRSGNCSRR